ncbi:MYO7B, partial [Symbiodinium necroappetens]
RASGRDGSHLFGVKHFAGEVFYEAAHFVRKNASAHRPDICTFLREHGGSFVRQMITTDESKHLAARGGRKLFGRTLINIFQQELNELCNTLEARDCRHIRCLRPNDDQKPLFFDDQSMLRQCRYSGLLE